MDQAALANALTWFAGLWQNKLAPTDAFYWGREEAASAINNGAAALTVADSSFPGMLNAEVAGSVKLVAPLKGPKGSASTVDITVLAIPAQGNTKAAQYFIDKYIVMPQLLRQKLEGPAALSVVNLKPDQEPWADVMKDFSSTNWRLDAPEQGSKTVCEALRSIVLGGYTPQQAAAWLLAK